MSPFYAGIDLGARSSWLCVVDAEGRKRLDGKTSNDPQRILSHFKRFVPGLQVVVESTFNWYWLVDLLQDQKIDVRLAHPLYLKAIAYAKVKTDQVDAHTLAQLLRLDYIPEAFIYPRNLRPTRDLLRRRHRLVSWRSDLYRVLQFQLMSHNITGYGRNAIKTLDGRTFRALLSHPHDRQTGQSILRLIGALDKEIARLEQTLFASVFRKKPVVLLKTIPGIGKVLAATIYYEVGQIHRFASDKAFSSYCRVVPTVAQSGAITRHGRNRKQGNRLLKWAFSEAAQLAIQGHPCVREYFHRILKKKKKRILAKAILAHKLAVAAFHVLRDEQPYQPGILMS